MNNVDISALEDVVKGFIKEKRFIHTLGVKDEAYRLGQVFMPDKCEKLMIAGLLHDITKNFSLDEQLKLCDEYGIYIDRENISPKLLHAKTGSEFARRNFGNEIVDDEIYYAIYYHTTGKEGMSLFEAIIYLADYIEKNRTFFDCVALRNYFYLNIEKCNTIEEKLEVLRKTMILSFDMTIKNLISDGEAIDFDTIKARNYFVKTKNCWR